MKLQSLAEPGGTGHRAATERVRSASPRQVPGASARVSYLRQLDQQENKLGTMRAERARLEDARAAAQKQLDGMLEKLAFDRKL